ncbi:MAG: hypothetical protein HOE90_07675 [Bacteriovoracaceae bacterium]|nr:hypothetical protein [Bacteriovoracaceae bacterium]
MKCIYHIFFFTTVFWFFSSSDAYSKEAHYSDSFRIIVIGSKMAVVSPKDFSVGQAVIIENKTLDYIRGKLQNADGVLLRHISIAPGKFDSQVLDGKKGEIFYFFPLSPSGQEAVLKVGNTPYEIPPKR